MKRFVLALGATGFLLAATTGVAQENPVDAFLHTLTPEGPARLAGYLGDCGGVYAAYSNTVVAQAPALAAEYRELSNGAVVAAAYLLYREHLVRTQQPKPFEDFITMVKGRAAVSEAEVGAAFAAGDLGEADGKLGDCSKLNELQTFLVDGWRAEMRP